MEDKNSTMSAADGKKKIIGLKNPGSFSTGNEKYDSIRMKAHSDFLEAKHKQMSDIFGNNLTDFFSGIDTLTIQDTHPIPKESHPKDLDFNIEGKNVIGKLIITNTEIRYWITPHIQKKGVILCDLQRAFIEHPEITKRAFSKKEHRRDTTLAHLVTAQAQIGSFLYVPDGVQLDGVFVIETEIDCKSRSLYLIQLITLMGKSAAGNLIVDIKTIDEERAPSLFVIQNDILLDDDSRLKIFQNQNASKKSALIISETIVEGRHAVINDCILDRGSGFLDRFVYVDSADEGGEAIITALYTPNQTQRFFYDTEQNHHSSYTVSDLLFKGVLRKDAYSIWKGNIFVAKGTVGANGYQANHILLAGENAKAESIPGLEILTDDVRCSHGVTMGNIDKNQMFYLQSRGINKQDAEKLIIDGFLLSTVKRIDDPSFEKYIQTALDQA